MSSISCKEDFPFFSILASSHCRFLLTAEKQLFWAKQVAKTSGLFSRFSCPRRCHTKWFTIHYASLLFVHVLQLPEFLDPIDLAVTLDQSNSWQSETMHCVTVTTGIGTSCVSVREVIIGNNRGTAGKMDHQCDSIISNLVHRGFSAAPEFCLTYISLISNSLCGSQSLCSASPHPRFQPNLVFCSFLRHSSCANHWIKWTSFSTLVQSHVKFYLVIKCGGCL